MSKYNIFYCTGMVCYDPQDDFFLDGDSKYMIVPDDNSGSAIFANTFPEALGIIEDLNKEESEVNK